MDSEVKEILEVKKGHKQGKTLTLTGIPAKVNEKMKTYQKKISYERNKKYTLKSSYVEFLKDAIKEISI